MEQSQSWGVACRKLFICIALQHCKKLNVCGQLFTCYELDCLDWLKRDLQTGLHQDFLLSAAKL